jgi:hypothetical protein
VTGAGPATACESIVAAVTASASECESIVEGEWRTSSWRGDRGVTGGENRERAGPAVYQSSKPGATTPMVGICSGPGTSSKSITSVDCCWWVGADAPTALAAGSTEVCETARSDAIVSAVAPAPSTAEAARGDR